MARDSWPPELADPDSILGQLQRGHGRAARAVVDGSVPEAGEMVVGCVRFDPRWDRQLDARADYYASLLATANVDVTVLIELVEEAEARPFDADPGASLALDVLLSCARRNRYAGELARDYLARGRYWRDAIDSLVYGPSWADPRSDWRQRVDGVPAILKDRWPTQADLADAFRSSWLDARRTPWPEWAVEDPEIGAAVASATERSGSRPPRERLRGRPAEELLALADPGELRAVAQKLKTRQTPRDVDAMLAVAADPGAPMHAAAVAGLAAQQRIEALPAVLALNESTRPLSVHALLFRALGDLPYETTRETVLEWIESTDPSRRRAAAAAMSAHAIAEDVPLARRHLAEELDRGLAGEQYLVCSYAQALARQPALGPFPELGRAFREMPYSYGRHFVVDALKATDTSFPAGSAVDCLWECEPSTRATAAVAVDRRDARAGKRLEQLAQDVEERPEVRSAARSTAV